MSNAQKQNNDQRERPHLPSGSEVPHIVHRPRAWSPIVLIPKRRNSGSAVFYLALTETTIASNTAYANRVTAGNMANRQQKKSNPYCPTCDQPWPASAPAPTSAPHVPAWKHFLQLESERISTSESTLATTIISVPLHDSESSKSSVQEEELSDTRLPAKLNATRRVAKRFRNELDGDDTSLEDSSVPHVSSKRARRSHPRVSYAQQSLSDTSDSDEEYMSNIVSMEITVSDHSDDNLNDESNVGLDDIGGDDEDDTTPVSDTFAKKRTVHTIPKSRKQPITASLPPMDNIDNIFKDMGFRAMELGFNEALKELDGRTLNVATMCSGTESPVIALELLSKGLETAKLQVPIRFKHLFSAEIDVIKQGYIARNFDTGIIYRDVREFCAKNVEKATTVYGSEAPIPKNVFLLIAGFVCKDLSRLNNHGKDLDQEGESGDTWRGIEAYARKFSPKIVLLENVSSTKKVWDGFKERWSSIGYDYAWIILDSKDYYIPQTRNRMYMIAVHRESFPGNSAKVTAEWRELIIKLQRPCSSPFEAFIINTPNLYNEHSTLSSEPDWPLSKLRYDQIRSEEGLGSRRPITRWSESGPGVRPPDFADRKWFASQTSRVYDCIDIAHLQAAKRGYDSLYKMMIWDVSQNVDRFKATLGVVPCITPSGMDFVTNRQTALTGSQLLFLQGIPYNKLIFGKESQRDRQDLAGNAMTTTVIGASIISALIAGRKAIRKYCDETRTQSENQAQTHQKAIFIPADMILPPNSTRLDSALDLQDLQKDAEFASQFCECEGSKRLSKALVHVCKECGHTSCHDCSGNPSHSYSKTIIPAQRLQTPNDFERKWRPLLPSRLQFNEFPSVTQLQGDIKSQSFLMSRFRRLEREWRVIYESSDASLHLVLASQQLSWYMYVKCPSSEPNNSHLRKALNAPVARGIVKASLLEADWEMHAPTMSKIVISGSSERSSSWENRLGLVGHQDKTTPTYLKISSSSKVLRDTYKLLLHCGTAMLSLYSKVMAGTEWATLPVFLFLDPDPVGPNDEDHFVFSHDCRRLPYGETRIILGSLDPSWRPWNHQTTEACPVTMEFNKWVPTDVYLKANSPQLVTKIPSASALASLGDDCSRAASILDIQSEEALSEENTAAHGYEPSQFMWLLEKVKNFASFAQWQDFISRHDTSSQHEYCHCSPSRPRILWSINEKGWATAHEDREGAAVFERSITTRSPIITIKPSCTPKGTRIQIGINIASLVHRAKSRLNYPGASAKWRLVTDHADSAPEKFPKFVLRSNSGDTPYSGPLQLTHSLDVAQQKSLSWMKQQEMGKEISLVEVEEAIHPGLCWRVEAEAKSIATVRGGVLADFPSFGKTVTTIALINSEFEDTAVTSIDRPASIEHSLIDVDATLIICPPHLAKQWISEMEKFLDELYEQYHVKLIERYEDLRRLKLDDIRKAKVIVVSWSVLADEAYIDQLAAFAALPPPASFQGRPYDTWLEYVSREMPDRVKTLLDLDQSASEFNMTNLALLNQRLASSEFKANLPLKIFHGSKYTSATKMTVPKQKDKPKTRSIDKFIVPLLQMFNFNRIVVDEYQYLYGKNNSGACSAIKLISAPKRWILSGTPSLANFSDVSQIASFLRIKLGRDVFGDGTGACMTTLEKRLEAEQTDVEKFLSCSEIMSYQWHQSRHQRAQKFLDDFVRQNEPSLQSIPCLEYLQPVELSVAHHAVYLELSQYLSSRRMQIRKLKKKGEREALHKILHNNNTAEEALIESALEFQNIGNDGKSGLDALIATRQEQRKATHAEVFKLAEELKRQCLKKISNKERDYYLGFQNAIDSENILGDDDARRFVRHKILDKINKSFPSTQRARNTKEKGLNPVKLLASELRATAHDLTQKIRLERFVNSTKSLLDAGSAAGTPHQLCSADGCIQPCNLSQLFLAINCGHILCELCLQKRSDSDSEFCIHQDCQAPVHKGNLIKVADLGLHRKEISNRDNRGNKLEAIIDLLKTIPTDDQAIVFVPNENAGKIISDLFKKQGTKIPHRFLDRSANAAEELEEFKRSGSNENNNKKKTLKVLILNLLSESAAGANLINANHVIFVSPLSTESQYTYDSAMAQAIARCRRRGQSKSVHVYHFAALRTIDVDILEHRHKRTDAIHCPNSTFLSPLALTQEGPVLSKKEKTRMVRNSRGVVALVPRSWVDSRIIDFDESSISFTSLISLPEVFKGDEDA